jgi:hemolysin III
MPPDCRHWRPVCCNLDGELKANRMISLREPTRGEFAADGAVHAVGIVAAVAGVVVLIALIAVRSGLVELVTALIYASGLLAMLGFSAAYNLAPRNRYREVFRRLDHAAIFIMIAGTYTPFTILGLEGAWELGLISLVWALALAGFSIKVFLPRRMDGFSTAIYLVLGWIGLIALEPFIAAFEPSILVLLLIGGLLYSIGTIFHLWRKLPYQNAIWHGFVVAAAAVHYSAVVDLVIHG